MAPPRSFLFVKYLCPLSLNTVPKQGRIFEGGGRKLTFDSRYSNLPLFLMVEVLGVNDAVIWFSARQPKAQAALLHLVLDIHHSTAP